MSVSKLFAGLFVFSVLVSSFYLISGRITGADQAETEKEVSVSEIRKGLAKVVYSIPEISLILGTNVCVEVLAKGKSVLSVVSKSGGKINVFPSVGCSKLDFHIKLKYDQFKKLLKDYSCPKILSGNVRALFLPSRFWKQGQNAPVCSAEFRKVYCAAISKCAGGSLPPSLVCCSSVNV